MQNIISIDAKKIGTILGYECFIPNDYFNHISFLKPNCPIWIKVTEEGDCVVLILRKGYAFSEIADCIKKNLPKRQGFYCEKPQDVNQLSCQILDEDDKICAEIIIDNNLNVTRIILGSKEENSWLQNYFLMDYNIKGYESEIVRIPNELYYKARQILNVLTDDKGYYIQLG